MFDAEFLKRLEYLSLLSKQAFNGKLLAQRRSKRIGSGIEFADHRDYLYGDDLRYLDWNVFARHGDLLLKRFQEEEDLHVYLLLDASASMDTGEPNKFRFARQIAAALAYIALADMDRVSVVAYDHKIVNTLPLMRGKNNVLRLLEFLESLSAGGEGTDLKAVVDDFSRRASKRGLALVISDLYDQEGFQAGIDRLRHQRFDPHVIQIQSPQEVSPPWLGDIELVDAETGRRSNRTITQEARQRYLDRFALFNESVDKYCHSYGLSHARATSDVPFDAVLLKMMRTANFTQ